MVYINQRDFSKAALFTGSVLQRRNTIPILSAIKVTANGSLVVEGTDLDTFARVEMPYDGEAAEFSLTDPGKLVKALKGAGGELVGFRHDEGDRRLHVEAGDLSSDLCALAPDDHPAMERVVDSLFGATVGGDFFRALERMRPAISTEETRYYLNGVYIHKLGDQLYRLVAADGYRLFVMDVPLPDASGELPPAILPRRFVSKAIETFRNTGEPVALALGYTAKSNQRDKTLDPPRAGVTHISFAGSVGKMKLELTSKLIDGTFPNYARVIPDKWEFTLRLQRAELCRAIRSLASLSTDKTRAVKLTLSKGELHAELNSPDIGKSRFAIAAEHGAPGGFEIGFNARYLLDVLDALMGDEAELRLTDATAPTIIVDPVDTAFLAVLMPMRV